MRRTVHCAKDMLPKKDESKTYRVERNETLGRYLVANRQLKQGEVVLKEDALLVGPQTNSQPLCVRCCKPLMSLSKLFQCPDCKSAPVCSVTCPGTGHPVGECVHFRDKWTKLGLRQFLENYQILTHLRCFYIRENDESKWNQLMSMESHLDKRRGTALWKLYEESVEKVLKELEIITEDDLKAETVQKLCGILDVNSFEIRMHGEGLLRGIFWEASLMAHDCLANTHLAVDDKFNMTIHAAENIKKDEKITFNYTNSLLGTEERQNHLREGKYFTCACLRCTDPTEKGTNMSSLKCPKCSAGYVLPNLVPSPEQQQWKCSECSKLLTSTECKDILQQCRKLLDSDNVSTSLREKETVLKKVLEILHPQHYYVLELKQSMIGDIRRIANPPRKVLQRKHELCKDILVILEAVEPRISRLKGIALYEMHVPEVVIANKEYENKEIGKEMLLEKLLRCETILKQAIGILLYEPSASPEGKLAAQALAELRILRDTITGVKNMPEIKNPDTGRRRRK